MKAVRFRIEEIIKVAALYLDYTIYLLLNPFKFKRKPQNIRKILVVELLKIGDLIVTTPSLKALKEKYPQAKIHLMVQKGFEDVLRGNRNIDRIITYHEGIRPTLKSEKYDLGVIFHPGSLKVSNLLRKAGVKYRIGCAKVGILSGKGYFLNKKMCPNTKPQHKTIDNIDVIKPLGIKISRKLEITVPEEAEKKVIKNFEKNNIRKKDYKVVLHLGSNYRTHEWSTERFIELGEYLITNRKAKIILTGSKKDKDKNEEVKSGLNCRALNTAGSTIKEFFAYIKQADLVVSIDTSAMHIASAYNKPIVALFGAGDPRVWQPLSENRKVIFNDKYCTSCMKGVCFRKGKRKQECMRSISVNQVIQNVEALK